MKVVPTDDGPLADDHPRVGVDADPRSTVVPANPPANPTKQIATAVPSVAEVETKMATDTPEGKLHGKTETKNPADAPRSNKSPGKFFSGKGVSFKRLRQNALNVVR